MKLRPLMIALFLLLPGSLKPQRVDLVRIIPQSPVPLLVLERGDLLPETTNFFLAKSSWAYLPASILKRLSEGRVGHAGERQEWPLSKAWAWSSTLRAGAGLRIILPEGIPHRVDSLTGLPLTSQRRGATREYSWQPGQALETGPAPRPQLVSLGTVSNQTGLGDWLAKYYFGQRPSAFGRALARSALTSRRAGVLERLAWIHQSLIQGADSLEARLLPGPGTEGVASSADYVRDFLQLALSMGLDARLVVPLSPRFGLPLGMVGLFVRSGKTERWYFPASRVFPPGRVPWYLDGLEALLIDSRAKLGRVRLSADRGGNSSYTLRVFVAKDGTSTANVSASYEGIDAAEVRAKILDKGKQATFSTLLYNAPLESLSVRHVVQLLAPLSLDASLKEAVTLTQADAILDSALRKRFSAGRSGNWSDRLLISIPAGSRITKIPSPVLRNRDGARLECRWKLIRGKVITKPQHWSLADWRRWTKDNIARQPDTLIRERKLSVGALKNRRTLAVLIEDLEDYGIPRITLRGGGRVR